MNLINFGDLLDFYIRFRDRGTKYVLKKFHLTSKNKVRSTWEDIDNPPLNLWQIPAVQKYWNNKVTGDEDVTYPWYVQKKYLKNKTDCNLLSVGCGTGTREIEFAQTGSFSKIDAFDFTPKCIEEASEQARALNLSNLNFFVGDIYNFDFSDKKYDVILFEHSLHHFKDINSLLQKVKLAMHPDSLLVINEYVGPDRFQFDKQRLVDSNKILQVIPKKFRERRVPGYFKNKIYAPGLWRVIQSDPSESVESSTIMPNLRSNFKIIEERGWGGNLLHFLLKDISHNYINDDEETKEILKFLFQQEDNLVAKEGGNDFMFGIYKI